MSDRDELSYWARTYLPPRQVEPRWKMRHAAIIALFCGGFLISVDVVWREVTACDPCEWSQQ